MKKPILCLDFDGVLHSYISGWQGVGVANDPPTAGAEQFLLSAARHFRLEIYSSRSKSFRGRACMKSYCRKHFDFPLTFSEDYSCDFLYEELHFPWFKPSAFLTIDDRALTFTGQWPSIEELQSFRPWMKR